VRTLRAVLLIASAAALLASLLLPRPAVFAPLPPFRWACCCSSAGQT